MVSKPLKNFPFPIGIAHWGIALCVVGSVISSLFVDIKNPASSLPIVIHVRIGYGVTFFLIFQWLFLSLKKYREVKTHVFPYHFEGRKCMMSDFRLLLKGRLPPTGARSGLSGLVEGFGILLITLMALTGLTFHFAEVFDVAKNTPTLFIRDIHNFFSFFVWAFVIGHGGMALLHRIIDKE